MKPNPNSPRLFRATPPPRKRRRWPLMVLAVLLALVLWMGQCEREAEPVHPHGEEVAAC